MIGSLQKLSSTFKIMNQITYKKPFYQPNFYFSKVIDDFMNFDEQMRQKYVNNKKPGSQEDAESIKQKIKEEYEQIADEILIEKKSILNDLREQLVGQNYQEEVTEQQKMDQYEKLFQSKYNQKQNQITDSERKQEQKRIFQDMLKQKPVSFQQNESISQNYGNYSSFHENHSYINDKRDTWGEFDDKAWTGKRIVEFIHGLPGDYREKKLLEAEFQKRKRQNPHLTEEEIKNQIQEEQHDIYYQRENRTFTIDTGDTPIDYEPENIVGNHRLSRQAKDKIYELFMEGWTLKALSERFGILPARVKAVVYLKYKFHYEILPNIDLHTLKLAIDLENQMSKESVPVDYGLDIDDLVKINRGVVTPSFSKYRDVDVLSTVKLDEKTQKLMDKFRQKKISHKITLDFIGKENKGYFIKEIKVQRGRGQNRVSYMFKRIVKHSHEPHKLPQKVQKKIDKGPRMAAAGYNNYGYSK